MENNRTIVLASTSPRRKELLESLGLSITTAESPFVEDMTGHEDPEALVRIFSRGKAMGVLASFPDAVIIAADTIVHFNDTIYGKPNSLDEAASMLLTLQGQTHTVFTGVTVIDARTGKQMTEVAQTSITLSSLTEKEIERYLQKGHSLDKAGGYAIQGIGATFTQSITGEYSNVVGLPLCLLRTILKEFDLDLL